MRSPGGDVSSDSVRLSEEQRLDWFFYNRFSTST
jgi:hypothetical protein